MLTSMLLQSRACLASQRPKAWCWGQLVSTGAVGLAGWVLLVLLLACLLCLLRGAVMLSKPDILTCSLPVQEQQVQWTVWSLQLHVKGMVGRHFAVRQRIAEECVVNDGDSQPSQLLCPAGNCLLLMPDFKQYVRRQDYQCTAWVMLA